MVSAMGSGSWVRSLAPRFSFEQPSTTVTSVFSNWHDHLYHDNVAGVLGIDLYHGWPQTNTKSLLQIIDHAAISILQSTD